MGETPFYLESVGDYHSIENGPFRIVAKCVSTNLVMKRLQWKKQ